MSYQSEQLKLKEDADGKAHWRLWGPYLAERQWGTVREDYSDNGDSWNSFTHEQSRSRAYRWGEDGLLGISDSRSFLCFAPALWNGADPILKERMFGLTNPEANHGEDVKECYYYLDATPSHSYLKALYKYPQRAFPYDWLLSENRRRSRQEPEFEILDTDAFDQGRYFDVLVEYAKPVPEDIWIRISVSNRGPDAAPIHVLPTLWFRNNWGWKGGWGANIPKPSLHASVQSVTAEHARLGRYLLLADPLRAQEGNGPEWLFCDNETNNARLWGGENASPWPKDAFHDYVVGGRKEAVNPAGVGTKAAAHYHAMLAPGETLELKLRLCKEELVGNASFEPFDDVINRCRQEADEFYQGMARPQDAQIFRQASAGLIWSKQFYYYRVDDWLKGDPLLAPPYGHSHGRNHDWTHVFSRDVIAMPDKWEFPWFATWDLAFHAIPYSILDPDFGKAQALLMMREWYMHPNGQLPAYEYDFGDVNPPVLATACRLLYQVHANQGHRDFHFLRRVYPKLLLNFTWWVNRKDAKGKNLFSGGFLGLDNIGVFNRSMTLPPGVELEQADGTAWMALFCMEMLALSLQLSSQDSAWEDMAVKFYEHFAAIETALNGKDGLWDETDGFYYDALRSGDRKIPLKVRSIVGVLPLLAFGVAASEKLEGLKEFTSRADWFARTHPGMKERFTQHTRDGADGKPVTRNMAALASRNQLERVLRYLFDESEFLSDHGIRSVSKIHAEHPYRLDIAGQHLEVNYLPGESDNTMFGGNSNWRGPIWMPINFMLVEALRRYHEFYGDSLKAEFPTGSGNWVNLDQAADALSERLIGIFRPNPEGYRPCHGAYERYAHDPHWKELILFYEYFHGDSGRGCGASHQTGWTALVSSLAFQMARKAERDKAPEEVEAMAGRE
ncbi:MAG TPA: glucosidase [Fibrobacteria bacterium]|nr:glucosidase [Fibrobacteria bacterium]